MERIRIEFDEAKRLKVLRERGLDFLDAPEVFAGKCAELEDKRKEYGEPRYRVFGFLHGRRVQVIWTPRGEVYRIITMMYAHEQDHEAKF